MDAEAILERFSMQGKAGTLAHAYLFGGSRGSGTGEIARTVAAEALKTASEKLAAHPDFFVLERGMDDKEISIDEIRALRQRLSLTAACGGYKVAIIERVELLAQESASALLKTLEEPQGKALIIMTTERHGAVLPTIRSRAVRVAFSPPKTDAAMDIPPASGKEFEKFFASIGEMPYGLRFKFAESWTKSPERYRQLLAFAAYLLRGEISDAAAHTSAPQKLIRRIRSLLRTDALVTHTNTNPRLALDVFFLNW
ncbi:MAG: hypothetical protein Q8Q39_04320 [bacterium]|nr:hypothetical protein [bacterium]